MYPGPSNTIDFDGDRPARLVKWKIKTLDAPLSRGTVLFVYKLADKELRFKCNTYGKVSKFLVQEGDEIHPGTALVEYIPCSHPCVIKDLCADCGQDLHTNTGSSTSASVSMIHTVPELRVTVERAEKLGKDDEETLLKSRKLVLLVDLDLTLIHTANEHVENSGQIKDLFKYRLSGPGDPNYYTKVRPYTYDFLQKISNKYQCHICTFGARLYAHTIAKFLDPTEEVFGNRILSRNECFDPTTKSGNLAGLFPCGDSMVCIIDDREDVWKSAPNLITVKPFLSNFLPKNTGDINSPFDRKDELNFHNFSSHTSKSEPSSDSDMPNGSVAKESKNQQDEKISCSEDKKTEEAKAPDKGHVMLESLSESSSSASEKAFSADSSPKEVKSEKEVDKEKEKKDEEVEGADDGKEEENKIDKLEDDDDYLLHLETILQRIHEEYFSRYDELIKYTSPDEHYSIPDLKKIVPEVKRKTLKEVNIVFSGVIPMNMNLKESKIYQMATSLGARVHKDINLDGSPLERTTHLIAAKHGTVKVIKALKSGKIHIVNPHWLFSCEERWERVPEALFPLSKEDDFTSVQERKLRSNRDENLLFGELQNPTAPSSNKSETQKSSEKSQGFSFYDPSTGLKVNSLSRFNTIDQKASTSDQSDKLVGGERPSQSMLQLSPLSGFSKNDLQQMDKEVDDACSEGDELSTGNTDSEDEGPGYSRKNEIEFEDEYEGESTNSEYPKGWEYNRKRKYAQLEDDETRDTFEGRSESSSEDDLNESSDDEMAAAVEREFLS
ncbi:RNA polymerase II subunit A C-terminal domain phosphatase Fcp1 isoform X2 [Brevipalpus obovatus]|uniref:RNA polymerase II subunit A C-terminal domain phosphatase Fcp1 isoform X2 n=1 Tax=Brevipalpus obovatus TaxID=246614 RepID=UPI003D9E71CC